MSSYRNDLGSSIAIKNTSLCNTLSKNVYISGKYVGIMCVILSEKRPLRFEVPYKYEHLISVQQTDGWAYSMMGSYGTPCEKDAIEGVYIMQCGNYFKVGFSKNPIKRLYSLQTGNPYNIRLCAVLKDIHSDSCLHYGLRTLFKSKGEWFKMAPEDYIAFLFRAGEEDFLTTYNTGTFCKYRPSELVSAGDTIEDHSDRIWDQIIMQYEIHSQRKKV